MNRLRLLIGFVILISVTNVLASDWIRPGINTNAPVWGLRGGLLWAISPGGFGGNGGPRGLIRLGYPVLPGGKYALVNFVAVEPIVNGQRGFSELEHSRLDNQSGLHLWAGDESNTNLVPGEIQHLTNGVEQLQVALRVEKYSNGAHVRLVVRQRSDRPDEVEFSIYSETDSAPIQFCILTATMGNMTRLRQLWLKDEVISSLKFYPDYKGDDFTPHAVFPLKRLHRARDGDVIVAATTNEKNPAAVYPFPGTGHWHYGGFPVTQYWLKPSDGISKNLQAIVNARFMYWRSHQPVPGGVAFENFELREPFHENQRFIFGITRKTPTALGFAKP